MKKLKYWLLLLSLTPIVTFAKEYYFDETGSVTPNYEIKLEIPQEKLDEVKNMNIIDHDIMLGSIEKTIVTTYKKDNNGNIIDVYSKILTPSEERMLEKNKNIYLLEDGKLHDLDSVCYINDSSIHETESKKVEIYYLSGMKNNVLTYEIQLVNTWKTNPIIHSYDLLGVRWEAVKYSNEYTVTGRQVTGFEDYPPVEYNESSSADHIKKFVNGAGLAQNLYDDVKPLYERMVIDSTEDFGTLVYGTYQHAVRDVSLSTANSYTIGPNGLGGVIDQDYPQYYDGMAGVYTPIL